MSLDDELFEAAKIDQRDIAKDLVEKEADVSAKGENGYSPLHRAADKGKLDIVKYLIQRRANINAEDNDKYTPLHKLLLKRPAPFPHVQNIIGKVTDNMNNMIDILNTTLKAEQTKVITLIGTVGDENSGLIKTINDLKSELEPPPMDTPEFI